MEVILSFSLSHSLSLFLSVFLSFLSFKTVDIPSPLFKWRVLRNVKSSVCLFVFSSVCLSVLLSFYLSVFLSVYLSICISICVSVCISIYMFVFLSVCLYIYLSDCLSLYLYVCLSFACFANNKSFEDIFPLSQTNKVIGNSTEAFSFLQNCFIFAFGFTPLSWLLNMPRN